MTDSKHWPTCYENENHPSCRLQRIRELEREVARLEREIAMAPWMTELVRMQPPIISKWPPEQSETVWCGGDEHVAPLTLTTTVAPLTQSGPVWKAVGIRGTLSTKVVPPPYPQSAIDRIPGSASWTAPCVDDPPVVLDAQHPVSRHPQGNV